MSFLKSLFSSSRKFDSERLATLEEQLETLAEAKVEGQPDIDLKLADLLNEAPPHMKMQLAKLFEEKTQQVKEDLGLAPEQELTPEQKETLRQMKEFEEQMVAHMLARKALRRIHALFLKNPAIMETVINIRQELHEKGVESLGINSAEKTVSSPTAGAAKEKDSTKGR